MKIAVCIKQVPESEARLRVAADGKWVEEEDLTFVVNESDEYALEEGLTIAEKTGGEVVVLFFDPLAVGRDAESRLGFGDLLDTDSNLHWLPSLTPHCGMESVARTTPSPSSPW